MWEVCPGSVRNTLVLLLLLIVQSHAGLESEVFVSQEHFRLTLSPRHVVRHVTRDVSLRCSHGDQRPSKFQSIIRIRLLRKYLETSRWQLLAEQRDTGDAPRTYLKTPVSGRIDPNVFGTFLQITWPVAIDDTFGTYRCDVIGLRKDSADMATESPSQLDIRGEDLNAADLLSLYTIAENELLDIKNTTSYFNEDIASLNGTFADLATEVDTQGGQIASLSKQLGSAGESMITARTELTILEREVDSLGVDVNSINDSLSTSAATAATLEGQVESVDGELQSVQTLVDSVSDDVSTIKADATTIQSANRTFETVSGHVSTAKTRLDSLNKDSETATQEIASLKGEAQRVSEKMASLGRKFQSVSDQMSRLTSLLEDHKASRGLVEKLRAWPEGQFALLQPQTGCPVDLTFAGQKDNYFKIHAESTSWDFLPPPFFLGDYTKVRIDSKRFVTLWFCEANGVFNTGPWPRGSYCINKIADADCPPGFEAGHVEITIENDGTVEEYTSRTVLHGTQMHFCCREDGIHTDLVKLPTDKPFILYQRGGTCQWVEGMRWTDPSLYIDTENDDNKDELIGSHPDISFSNEERWPMRIQLCYYKKREE